MFLKLEISPLFVIAGSECGGGKRARAVPVSVALGPARGVREGGSGIEK